MLRFLFAFLMFPVSAFPQSILKGLTMTNTITKTVGDTTYTFKVKSEKDDFDHDFRKRYFWFGQGELRSTQGNHSGKLLEGVMEKFDRRNILVEKGEFLGGLKDGVWLTWYTNGTLARKYVWKEGSHEGQFDEYFENGAPKIHGRYYHDQKTGTVTFYAPDGSTAATQRFKRGVLRKEKIKKVKSSKDSAAVVPFKRVKKKKKDETPTPGQLDTIPVAPAPEKTKKEKKKKTKDVVSPITT